MTKELADTVAKALTDAAKSINLPPLADTVAKQLTAPELVRILVASVVTVADASTLAEPNKVTPPAKEENGVCENALKPNII